MGGRSGSSPSAIWPSKRTLVPRSPTSARPSPTCDGPQRVGLPRLDRPATQDHVRRRRGGGRAGHGLHHRARRRAARRAAGPGLAVRPEQEGPGPVSHAEPRRPDGAREPGRVGRSGQYGRSGGRVRPVARLPRRRRRTRGHHGAGTGVVENHAATGVAQFVTGLSHADLDSTVHPGTVAYQLGARLVTTTQPASAVEREPRGHWGVVALFLAAIAVALLLNGFAEHTVGRTSTPSPDTGGGSSGLDDARPVLDLSREPPRAMGMPARTVAVTFDD